MANLQRLVCAMSVRDAGVAGGDPCVLREIRKDQCRNLDCVVIARSAVAAKTELCARASADMQNEIVTFACARYECRVLP